MAVGYLVYGSSTYVAFDDRVLAHLEVVIINKLRRRESFAVSWRDSKETGDGRTTIWIDPSLPLRFHFDGSRPPAIDKDWLEELDVSAASSTGLVVVDEQGNTAIGSVIAGRN